MRPNVKMSGDELLMSQVLRQLEVKEWKVRPDALVPFATWDVVLWVGIGTITTVCLVVAGLP